MKKISLARRERRVLAVGTMVIVGLITASRGLPAWRAWQSALIASAAELTTEAERAETTVRSLPATLDSLEARKQRFIGLAPLLVGAGSPGASTSTLSTLVSGMAEAAGVRLATIRVGIDTTRGLVVRRVWASAELEGDIRGISSLLAKLESGPTLLAVRELSIAQPDPGAPDDRPEVLNVRLRVEGLAIDRSSIAEGEP